MSWPRQKIFQRSSRTAAICLAAIRLAAILAAWALPAAAQPPPPPEIPLAGVYTAWLEREVYEREGWIRGMNHRHWLPPFQRPQSKLTPYYREEIRVLPELDWVLVLRTPAIFEQFSVAAGGADPFASRLRAAWPADVRRDLLPRDVFLERLFAQHRRELFLTKIKQTRAESGALSGKTSLIDINIPINLPKSVERVVGRGEKSNITVTGRESITFSGETSRTNKFLADESGRGQSLFPRLEMKQELQVQLSGTVGEKVHVEVENNSLALGPEANRIRIRYQGDEDEIVKLIEMGDTQLSLPSSGLVSHSSSNKGLFGVKAEGSLGPLDLTAIASKQEGEMASRTFNNTGQVLQSDFVLDTQFLANQFFYLDRPHNADGDTLIGEDPINGADDDGDGLTDEDPLPPSFYVWTVDEGSLQFFVDDHNPMIAGQTPEYAGFVFADTLGNGLADDIPDDTSNLDPGSFKLLELGRDYRLLMDSNSVFRAVQLNFPLQESDVLAVSYVAIDGAGGPHEIGTISISGVQPISEIDPETIAVGDQNALTLELIKPEVFQAASPTWDYMLRNVYRLGSRNLDYKSLGLEIHRQSTQVDPSHPVDDERSYLQIFGLDQYLSDNRNFGHDHKIDLAWVDVEEGLLFMPWRSPFNPPSSLVCAWTAISPGILSDCYELAPADQNPTLYEVSHTELLRNPQYSKYIIRFTSSTVGSRFVLGAFDILEGSEVVTLDGQQLTRGTDYRIDYFSGEVELIGEKATLLSPSSNVQITYQFRPVVGGGKSNLLGLHGTYNLSDKNKLASSWLYESQHSGARRPRLGEESTRNVVGNILGNFSANSDFLTSAVNLLPLVDTDAVSTVSLSGEMAVSFPNPNIEGAAYLDDMEGAEDADELSLHRSRWALASEPKDRIRVIGGGDIDVDPAARAEGAYWYHPQNTTFRRDFNLNLPEQEGQETVEVLRLAVPVNLNETQLAAYPPLADTNAANAARGDSLWVGLMQGFGGDGLDLREAEYIEIWINDSQQDKDFRTGRVHFDLGDLDEDFWNPELDLLDSEDRINQGIFDELDEDTGLDGVYDLSEADTGNPYAGDQDPGGDDYEAEEVDADYGGSFFKVNGMEGNRRLDTEDLDGDRQLDTRNSYFTLDIPLDAEPLIDMVDIYSQSGATPDGSKAWRLYRLNLDEARTVSEGLGEPDWNRIKYFRFWVEGMNGRAQQNPERPFNFLEIASIKIVGNRWKSHGIQTTADGRTLPPADLAAGEDLRVEVINTKDNANFFWPFGEQIDPETGLPEREQALNFVYENIAAGHQALIRKDYQSLNLTGYRVASFYVRSSEASQDREVFFRAAFDSTAYYELRYRPDRTDWTEINLELSDWTNLKLGSESDSASAVVPDAYASGRSYTIRRVGQPDLNRIRAIYFGIVNPADAAPLTGETWLNDIRVKDVRRDQGVAAKLTGAVNLGNVINFGASFQKTDAEFRGLRSNQGSGSINQSWSLNASANLQQFVPLAGFKVPLNGSYSNSASVPKYELGSDVILTEPALREANRTETVTQQISASLSRSPSRTLLGRILLDNFRLRGSLSQTRSLGPTRVSVNEAMDYAVSYELGGIKERQLRLFKSTALRWVPNSIRLNTGIQRSRQKSWTAVGAGQRFNQNPSTPTGRMTDSAAMQWNFFPSLLTDFSISDVRELEHEQAQRTRVAGVDLNLGYQTSQGQSLRIDYTLPLFRRFKPKFKFDSQYSQSRAIVTTYGGEAPRQSMNLNNRNSISTGYSLEIGKLFEKLGGDRIQKKQPAVPGAGPGEGPGAPGEVPVMAKFRPRRVLVPVDPLRGPDPRQKSRSTRRFIAEEVATPVLPGAEAATDSTTGGPDPMIAVWKTLGVLAGLKPLKLDVSRRVDTVFNNVQGDPSLLYRLGLAEDAQVPGLDNSNPSLPRVLPHKSADQLNESREFNLSTGVTLAERVQVSTSYEWNGGDRRAIRARSQNSTKKWPSFSVDLSGVEKWPLWGDMMETSSIGVSYAKTSTENKNVGTGTGSRNESSALTPRWGITWRNKMRTNLSASYSKSLDFNNTQTTKNSSLGGSADFSYNFSAPQGLAIPGLRGIHFKSRLDLTATLSYSRGHNAIIEASGFERPLGGSSTLTISPGARYQFTEKLSGGATLRYNRNSRDLTGEVVTSLGLSINTTFIF